MQQPPYNNQPPYGQPPQQPYGGNQPPYGQPQPPQQPYGGNQPPYGQPQPPYGQPPYQQPPYGQPQYGQGGGDSWQPPPGGGDDWKTPPDRNWLLIGGLAAGGVFCLLVVAILICVLTLTSGDSNEVGDPTAASNLGAPSVTISQPTNGQTFTVGNTVTVQAQALDPSGSGVTRVELLVNNVVVDSQTSQEALGSKSLAVLLDYTAAVPMPSLTLTVRPYRGVVRGTDATVAVVVNSATGNNTTGNNTTGNNTTGSNTTGNNTTVRPPATATQAPFNPTCRARVDVETLNIRSGPSVDYDILTRLALGNEAPLVGRLGDNSWWQVTSGNTRGWVSAAYTTLLGNCGNVPAVNPPSSPTPTVTVTSAAPTQANLVVSNLSGSTSIPLTGGEVAASYVLRVKNIGSTNADKAFNVTITYPNGQVFDYTVPSLAAGQEFNIPDITAKFTSPGTYRLSVFVDSSGNITESSKDDNLAILDIVVTSPTPTPEGQ